MPALFFQSYITMEHLIIIAVKHTVCRLYQFCQEICRHAVLQLPTAVSHAAVTTQFSVQDETVTWEQDFALYWLSLCSQRPRLGQHESCSCQVRKGRFTSHLGNKSSPIQHNPSGKVLRGTVCDRCVHRA